MSSHRPGPELLASVFDAMPAYVSVLDADLRVVYANRVPRGVDPNETVGRSVLDFVDPDKVEATRTALEQVLATGRATVFYSSGLGQDGATAHYRNHVTRIGDPGGTCNLCLVSFDLTPERTREQALQEERTRRDLSTEASGVGLWSWDLETDTVEWDRGMHRLTGLDEPVALDEFVARLVHPDDRQMALAGGERASEGTEFPESVLRLIRPSGEIRFVLTRGRVLLRPDGTPRAHIGACLDITEQRRTEERLREAQRLEVIGGLTAGVAHHFNNMLAVMMPTLDMLRPLVPADARSMLEDAHSAATRAAGLVGQLMVFGGQRQGAAPEPTDLVKCAELVVQGGPGSVTRDVQVELHAKAAAVWALCAPVEFERVLMALLDNARDALIQAGTPDPRITVELGVDAPTDPASGPGTAWVVVRDNGPGMTPDVAKRAFEPFFTTKVAQGAGMGLATALGIVRDAGGTLTCETRPGHGAAFTITLPGAWTAKAPADTGDAGEPAAPLRVLVVDDEPALRRMVARVLERDGHQVAVAASVAEARQVLAARGAFDVVLLDRSMPMERGDVLVPELREQGSGVRILFVTGEATDEGTAGVDAVIHKPFELDQLRRVVRGSDS